MYKLNSRWVLQLGLLCFAVWMCGLPGASASGKCVMYDQCKTDPTTGHSLNCPYDGPAKQLTNQTYINMLLEVCPQYVNNTANGTETAVCCAPSQIKTLAENLEVPRQFFERCPSCLRNFFNLFCTFTCDPEQSSFMRIAPLFPGFPIPPGIPINKLDVSVSETYANAMYESCENVLMPSNNQKALDVLCGTEASKCNPKVWFKFLGDPQINPEVPFTIGFEIKKEKWGDIYPMNVTTTPCNASAGLGMDACSCQDCPRSCSAPPPTLPAPTVPATVYGQDPVTFWCYVVFVAFVLLLVVAECCYCLGRRTLRGEEGIFISGSASISTKSRKPKAPIHHRFAYQMECYLESLFTMWGRLCARYWYVVILATLCIALVLGLGILKFKVVDDPVELWSSPDSDARQQKDYFDKHFNPFFRAELVIISLKNEAQIVMEEKPPRVGSFVVGSMFNKTILHEILDIQLAIENITAEYEGELVGLQDICYAPLAPDNNNCTIQSVLNYFQNDHVELDKEVHLSVFPRYLLADYIDHIKYCFSAPTSIADTTPLHQSCLGTFGGPVMPWVAVGGYDGEEYVNGTALVLTFLVRNSLNEEHIGKARAWEKEYINFLKDGKHIDDKFKVSFMAERSIQDEIDRQSYADISIMAISYAVLFGYILLVLGMFRSFSTVLVDVKVSLASAGILVVLMSVACSIGIYSYAGIPVTLIIIEVVPFLVLAVGADNIFILMQTFQRSDRREGETLEMHLGRVVGMVGPSMMLTSISECVAFFFGALTDMPAVRIFSLYAAMAVLIDFLLQISIFVSLMYLDARRHEAGRLDVGCCLTQKSATNVPKKEGSFSFMVVKKLYAPFLMHKYVRPGVLVVFVGWLLTCVSVINKVHVGLDQRLAMPKDSYVLDLFEAQAEHLRVGAPVYFVVKDGLNYSSKPYQNAICGASGCDEDSMFGLIKRAAQLPEASYIAQPPNNWLDDYFAWISPRGNPPCCRKHNNGGDFCPATDETSSCTGCFSKSAVEASRPQGDNFNRYLPWYLKDNPNIKCVKGGHAAYGDLVEITDTGHVGATAFMTYHTILKESNDYVGALRNARKLAKDIEIKLNNISDSDSDYEVFPYSIFYVFYEQYLDIVKVSYTNLLTCLAAIFAMTFVVLGFDPWAALITCVTIAMIVVNMFGLMYFWDISLNAISLVNLIMGIGISVEFCSHIIRAFALSRRETRLERATEALTNIGSSVISGVAMTNLPPTVVLAFTNSQLFQVFYFRMFLGILIFALAHGVIFLPVLLSYIGPGVNQAMLNADISDEDEAESSRGVSLYERTEHTDLRGETEGKGEVNDAYENLDSVSEDGKSNGVKHDRLGHTQYSFDKDKRVVVPNTSL